MTGKKQSGDGKPASVCTFCPAKAFGSRALFDLMHPQETPTATISQYLDKLHAIAEFGMAIEDSSYRGNSMDLAELRMRMEARIEPQKVVEAIRKADMSDSTVRNMVIQIAGRTEDPSVKAAAESAVAPYRELH
jgi:hypothetical protein